MSAFTRGTVVRDARTPRLLQPYNDRDITTSSVPGPPGTAPTPLLESGLEPEPTTWAIRRPDEDERESEALL